MEEWNQIRQWILREGLSISEVQRRTGKHFVTIKKVLDSPSPPEFRCPMREKPKIGAFMERITGIVKADKSMHRKQRHTAKRIFEVIQAEGYSGSYTSVKNAVRELKQTSQEVFVPLIHRPGEAQMDFGEALVKMDGVLRKVMILPWCFRTRGQCPSRLMSANARKHFRTVMYERLTSSVAYPSASVMTMPKRRWRKFWVPTSVS